MVFKRGVALLAIAATAALVSVDAAPIKVQTDLKNPVVKDVKTDHGKLILTLQEGATIKKAKKHAVKHHDDKKKKKHDAVKHTDVKKMDVKKPAAVKVQKKKDQHKKHPSEKKHEAKKAAHKQVSEEKKGHEVIRKYAHGQVRVMAKNQPAAKAEAEAKHKKKDAKKVVAKQVEETEDDSDDTDELSDDSSNEGDSDEEADVDLKVGESVTVEFGDHTVGLELLANGSLVLTTDDETYVLPKADSIDLTIDDSDDSDDSGSNDDDVASSTVGSSSSSGSSHAVGEVSFLDEVEGEASMVAKKFTELATKLTGNGKFFSKEAAPVIFIGGCIGALAAIAGIAAIAIGRSRNNSAAADPSSVLANPTEDLETGAEAAATTEEETSEDAAADETQSLSSSDSESEAEEGAEEGKFTNGVVSV